MIRGRGCERAFLLQFRRLYVKITGYKLRDFASWLHLATGASFKNLVPIFLSITVRFGVWRNIGKTRSLNSFLESASWTVQSPGLKGVAKVRFVHWKRISFLSLLFFARPRYKTGKAIHQSNSMAADIHICDITGWPSSLSKTSRCHWCESCILVQGPHILMQLQKSMSTGGFIQAAWSPCTTSSLSDLDAIKTKLRRSIDWHRKYNSRLAGPAKHLVLSKSAARPRIAH